MLIFYHHVLNMDYCSTVMSTCLLYMYNIHNIRDLLICSDFLQYNNNIILLFYFTVPMSQLLPLHPGLHWQVQDPIVLLQAPCIHGMFRHSLISANISRSYIRTQVIQNIMIQRLIYFQTWLKIASKHVMIWQR